MRKLKYSVLTLLLLSGFVSAVMAQNPTSDIYEPFLGEWSLDIENGKVGWLKIHNDEGYLDGEMMWVGGSAAPVSFIYMADEQTMVVSRAYARDKTNSDGTKRKLISSSALRLTRVGDHLAGELVGPLWNGMGEERANCIGTRMPVMPPAPNLSKVKYGKPIQLFNGKNLDGWHMIDPEHANGFKAMDGELINDPVQNTPGKYIHYGNIRTAAEFTDFNLTLEVNVPKGDNSGIYIRGMYEIQVYDSYGKDLDSHHMGALYSRITPTVAAEKPAGEWQTVDITFVDRHVTVILNGQTIIDNKPVAGPTGGAIKSNVLLPGPIFLQGDHGNVKYRNIVLREVM